MSKVVEVRLGCVMHDLTEDQVFGLLRAFPEFEVSVGLGFAGEPAVVVLDVEDSTAPVLGETIADTARSLGLTPSLVEVLEPDEYETRALAELDA